MKMTLFLVSLIVSGSAAATDDPEQLVRNYFSAYSDGATGSDLVATFWMPTLVVNSRGATSSQIPATAFASSLESFRANEVNKGWKGSEVTHLQSCILRDDLALVSVEYERQYEDGNSMPDAVVYTLSKNEKWRLSSVTPVDPGVPIRCDEKQ